MKDSLFTDAESLAAFLIEKLSPFLHGEYYFYGHSLGSVLAYEITLQLQRLRLPLPRRLLVAARRAPHVPSKSPYLHLMSDDDLAQELLRYEATPPTIFENPELRAIFLPILRADFTIVETYTPPLHETLNTPITVFGGVRDPFVDVEELHLWRERTAKSCDVHLIEDGHFFSRESFRTVIEVLTKHQGEVAIEQSRGIGNSFELGATSAVRS